MRDEEIFTRKMEAATRALDRLEVQAKRKARLAEMEAKADRIVAKAEHLLHVHKGGTIQ